MKIKHAKRGISSLPLSLFLVLTIFSLGIGMAAANPSVSIAPSSTNVGVGADFSVFIEIDPDAATVETALIDLTYDSTKVSVTGVVMNSAAFPINSDGTQSAGAIDNIMGLSTAGLTTTANLAEIKMRADAAGTFTIGLSGSLTKPPGDPLTPVDMESGTVTIAGPANPTVSIFTPAPDVDVGADFSVFIEIDPATVAVESALLDLTYDSTKVSVTGIVMNAADFPINDQGTQSAGAIDDIMGLNTATGGLTTAANLAEIKMRADAAGTFTIGISGSLTKPPNGDPLTPVDMKPGTMTIVVPDAKPVPDITAPADGATISDTVTVSAIDQSGEGDIVSCDFTYTGASSGTIGSGTEVSGVWSYDWDTTGVTDGTYTIYAMMTDGAPQTGVDQITVTLDNNEDPTVTVISPVSGVVSGMIDVTATAADTDGFVTQVAFYLMPADSLIGTDTNGADGWGVSLDTTAETDGAHRIKAVATDNESATGDNTGGEFTIDNACPCDFCLDLKEGWNFVSVPKRIDGTNDATTIFDLDPANETCEYYNASAGSWMNPADIDVVPCQGYWVWKVSEKTVCIDFLSTGAITPPTQQLKEGWNMIGHIDTSVMPIYEEGNDADFGSMANIEGKFSQIWQWTQNDGWDVCYPSGLNYMTPGQGYWIWMTEDAPMAGTP